MALPTLAKTWQISVNNTTTAGSDNEQSCDRALISVKNRLIAFATNPWTVVGSSNGTVAGLDGVDRWTTDLVHGSTSLPHSWMVLKQAQMDGGNFQLLIDCNVGGAGYQNAWSVSHSAGFTGGDVSTAPTATDQHELFNAPHFPTSGSFRAIINAMQSTDGKCTRVFYCVNNMVLGCLIVETLGNTVTGWTRPHIAAFLGTTSSDVIVRSLLLANGMCWRQLSANRDKNYATLTGEYAQSQALGALFSLVSNEISAEWPIDPIGFASVETGFSGRHGSLVDLWWGSSFHAIGTTYPSGAGRQFAQFGHLVFPWNGVNAPITA